MKAILALLAVVVFAGAFFWEQSQLLRLRAGNEALRAEQREADQLAAENRELPKLRPEGEAPKFDRTELLRLRNQVGKLRAQQLEVNKLRAANERLGEEIKVGKFAPRRLADMEGAVPREKWVYAGFATPEATVQSFLSAVLSGDPEQFLNCASPEDAEQIRKELAKDPDGFRKSLEKEFGKMSTISAFRITGVVPKGDDGGRVEVRVQMVVDGESMPLPLKRVGNEWKLGD